MRPSVSKSLQAAAGAVALALLAGQASAALLITEVQPSSSGSAPYTADWFELTNTGPSAVTINTSWRMDDSSPSYATGVALNGITSIAAGESVIFIESALGAAIPGFLSAWFGSTPPSGLKVGYYSGSGVGLSTGGDAVNIFDASGSLQASVSFGVADATSPFSTFDNTAGVNNGPISLQSQVGVNGAFAAAASPEIGSPGVYAPPAPVPLPAAALLLLGGLGGLVPAGLRRRRRSA